MSIETTMNMDIKVDVILAAHNGAKFIRQQIQSILEQSHYSLNLIVTDDGSTDETSEIVNAIANSDSRVSYHICYNSHGVVQNFNNGIKFSSADYILFCDQDDVWEKNKIESMLNEICSKEIVDGKKKPCLGFSNLKVVDEELNIIHNDFYVYSNLNPNNNLKLEYLTWRSSVYGCTVIMNSLLLKIAGDVPKNIAMHDHWYAFQAALYGKVFYYSHALVNYRQHPENVVGAHRRSNLARIKRVNKTLTGIKRSIISARVMFRLVEGMNSQAKLTKLQKILFLKKFVLPYFFERVAYSMIFSIYWLIYE